MQADGGPKQESSQILEKIWVRFLLVVAIVYTLDKLTISKYRSVLEYSYFCYENRGRNLFILCWLPSFPRLIVAWSPDCLFFQLLFRVRKTFFKQCISTHKKILWQYADDQNSLKWGGEFNYAIVPKMLDTHYHSDFHQKKKLLFAFE